LDRAGIADGQESFDKALHRRSGYLLDDFRPIEDTKAVTVPTLVAQVHDDSTMPPPYLQEIYDNISVEDKMQERLARLAEKLLTLRTCSTGDYQAAATAACGACSRRVQTSLASSTNASAARDR
jgi:hypothetical protein